MDAKGALRSWHTPARSSACPFSAPGSLSSAAGVQAVSSAGRNGPSLPGRIRVVLRVVRRSALAPALELPIEGSTVHAEVARCGCLVAAERFEDLRDVSAFHLLHRKDGGGIGGADGYLR